MGNKIEHPKVFISYAHGTDDYNQRVYKLAENLKKDGIDIVIDKWNLKAGNDLYAFMEKCVNDPSITNVLMLLDTNYARKANERVGGVGVESAIISPEIYQDSNQDRFVPVVMQKNPNNKVPRPAFLTSKLYYDLTGDNPKGAYHELVRQLYGKDPVPSPKLGEKPQWVDDDKPGANDSIVESIQLELPETEESIKVKYKDILDSIGDRMISCYKDEEKSIQSNVDQMSAGLIRAYDKLIPLRDKFLEQLKQSSNVHDAHHIIASVMESICSKSLDSFCEEWNLVRIMLNEIFVYLIAHLLRHGRFDDIAYYFGKKYYASARAYQDGCTFNLFQGNNEYFDEAVSQMHGTTYAQGTAKYWMDKFNPVLCDKNEFLLADVLCFNASVFRFDSCMDYWIPSTYVYLYLEYDNNPFVPFAAQLKSMEGLKNIATAFGYQRRDEFRSRYEEVEGNMARGSYRSLRYGDMVIEAPLLCKYVKSQDLAN